MKTTVKMLAAAAVGVGAFALSARAETFGTNVSAYWGESYTDATGNYQSPAANTSVSGGVLVAPILTDGTQALANMGYPAGGNEVNNYVRTFRNTSPVVAGGYYAGSLLGDLSGKTSLSATFNITNSTYTGQSQFQLSDLVGESFPGGDQSVAGNPSIRLTFTGSDAGNDVWFSTAGVNVTSMSNGVDVTLTVNFTPGLWSNINGINGAADVAGFNSALSNVTRLGLSFGSGDFYSDGFAFNTGGTASLNLNSIETASPVPLPASAWSGLGLLGGLALLGGAKRVRRQVA